MAKSIPAWGIQFWNVANTIFITFLRPSVESEKVSDFLCFSEGKSVLVNKMAPYQMLINL